MTKQSSEKKRGVNTQAQTSFPHEQVLSITEEILNNEVIDSMPLDDISNVHVNESFQNDPFEDAVQLNAQAMGMDASEHIVKLKQQEKEKLNLLFTELKAQAASLSTVMVTSAPKVEKNTLSSLDGLRLKGPLLPPLAGMQKIKAVHQMGLADLLENIGDTIPFIDNTEE
ncbi:hypothetical protein [uncultured Shewanella sp.]|uniref:hypothetical protein n=1 Tax=uncultured Shewanella sp. TaxID=173975 RepID=UPI0026194061|nr:hypothetical protein [uncultured Shewanella sp.]